ncbi:MAG TPA: glucose-6-phosphate dehydrogenase [Candidatus Paceibacterota bacterium]|nr:glucose-6-phosphate dehydrogenase [Candidatus Paceibacterota bacterium]
MPTPKITIRKPSVPTVFIVLGATGDLMTKKIAPALFHLFEEKRLPENFKLIGISRRDWHDEDLRRHIEAILSVKVPNARRESVEAFLNLAVYHKVMFENHGDYVALKNELERIDNERGMCANKLFYLSVPPQFYAEIMDNMKRAGLHEECAVPVQHFPAGSVDEKTVNEGRQGWTRIIIEKPFGRDEKSAKALDAKLSKIFKEDQIYRIDHYLAKETFQNILAFRFYNNLFENAWGKEMIDTIYVRELENVGVEDRGPFYDPLGALRDVGQNHLLQMVALVTMGQPRSLNADEVRARRTEILKALRPMTPDEVAKQTFRGQYEGYQSVKGVMPNSETETYFRARFSIAHPRWEGVKFVMEAGKRLIDPNEHKEVTEIEVLLSHPQPCLCPPGGRHYRDSIIFRQDPNEGITIRFWSKKPGFAMEVEERTFEFQLRNGGHESQYTEEYEKLLLDCVNGDQTLFISSDEIAAMWRFVDPIERGWAKGLVPLAHYVPDNSTVTREAAALVDGPRVDAGVKKEIGVYGLGKMGGNVARQLRDKGWHVVVSNRSAAPVEAMQQEGFEGAVGAKDLADKLGAPRVIWMMITAGPGIDEFLFGSKGGRGTQPSDGLVKFLRKGDVVIDGANSYYEDTMRRAKLLAKKGIGFMDVGFSGGPSGARNGGSLMIGGDGKLFEKLEPLFRDLSVPGGYSHFGAAGSGHYVKMVHNGIEYGMMQAIAEGFGLMKKSPFKLDLKKIANVYNHGSVIESRLVGWLESAFNDYGTDLKAVSGSVAYTGEGEWTIRSAKKIKMKLPVIEDAFRFRVKSKNNPSYTGKVVSALRNRFGGHSIEGQNAKANKGSIAGKKKG